MPRIRSTFDGEHRDSGVSVNLRKLIQAQAGGSVNAWVHKFGGELSQTTINRIYNGQQDTSIEMLLRISDLTGYAPWQLLHPDFDPKHMPPLGDPDAMRVAAIYAGLKSDADRRRVRAILEQFADE